MTDKKAVPVVSGARHEGRPGWRYAILGPTEAGKTTMAVRFAKLWEKTYPAGLVYSNFRLFNGEVDEVGRRLIDPNWRTIKDPRMFSKLTGKKNPVLLVMDEFSKYLNSIPGFTSNDILKVLIDLANNLMKQDVELVYTDQWPRALHVRVRTNVNRAFLPRYEESTGTIEYHYWPTIEEFIERDELSRQGPYQFSAKDWFPFFDTKEIISPKMPKFNGLKEAVMMVKWAGKKNKPVPESKGITDFINFYLTETNKVWGNQQVGSVRYALKELLGLGDKEEETKKKKKKGEDDWE